MAIVEPLALLVVLLPRYNYRYVWLQHRQLKNTFEASNRQDSRFAKCQERNF